MAWIVDGNNLLAQIPGTSMNDPADRRRLASSLARLCDARRLRMLLYFDGEPVAGWRGATALGRLRIRHSGSGRSADEAILDEVAVTPRGTDAIVVTSDRALSDRCRSRGARLVSVRKLRSMLAEAEQRATKGAEKPEGPEPGEIDYFMELFGGAGETPSRSRRRR